jgi:hypothetical protein
VGGKHVYSGNQVGKEGGNIYLDIGCDYWVRGIWYQGWHSHTV